MARGHLRIYLGAAPGVGKTYAMLNEGRRRRERGTDVVVGWVDTHGRASTAAQLEGLEVVPRQRVRYRDAELEELDLQAVLDRRPAVALIDELAHTNVPGSRHAKRWEDVEVLLERGIDVISTLNVQHLESLNDVVERITGIVQRETVPDEWVRRAGQIELVDMTPEALRRRMAHGNIYAAERIDAALGNYFRPGNLAALRELALLWLADRVEDGLQDYMEAHGIDHAWETRERIVVTITGAPGGEGLLRRAARIARRARGELIGVHVLATDGRAARDDSLLDGHRRLLLELGGRYTEVVGADVAEALVTFARAERATQLVLGATRQPRWRSYVGGSVVGRVIAAADEMDVHVISTKRLLAHEAAPRGGGRRVPGPSVGFSRRRWVAAWITLVVALPLLAGVLVLLRDDLATSTVVLLFLLPVLVVTALGGTLPGLVAAAVALLLDVVWFIPPYGTLRVSKGEDVAAMVVFLVVSVVLSTMFGRLARRSVEAHRAQAEAEAMARAFVASGGDDDPLAATIEQLRLSFGLEGVGVFEADGEGGWRLAASSGDRPPAGPDDGQQVPVDQGLLVVVGARTTADERRLLATFAARLSLLLEGRRGRAALVAARALGELDGLRVELTQAAARDMVAPLAAVRATLVADPPTVVGGDLDVLDGLVREVLELGALDAQAIDEGSEVVALGEVVRTALVGLSAPAVTVTTDVPVDLPPVRVHGGLLVRAVAGVVSEALAWSPPEEVVRIQAAAVGSEVLLQVVDRGPGASHGPQDGSSPLGLAERLVVVAGGDFRVEETPAGGTTVVITLQAARQVSDPGEGPLTAS